MKQCRVRLEIRQLFTTDPRSGEHGRGGNQTTAATGRGQSGNAVTRQQILRQDVAGKHSDLSLPAVARKFLTIVSCDSSLTHWQGDHSESRFVCSSGVGSNHHLGRGKRSARKARKVAKRSKCVLRAKPVDVCELRFLKPRRWKPFNKSFNRIRVGDTGG